ncbi:MAG: heavy-metal-associated domain-containing protein [Acidobacteria bacterium]|nr:heavy-metal-associated domain-containing protein [Acidobacteriota bacterium]
MTSVTLSVLDISCGHCKTSIEGAVSELNGVDTVEVNIDKRTVDIAFAESLTTETIIDAIESQGYDVAQ